MNKVLILVPCSGSKRKGGTAIYNANCSILDHLNNTARERLLNLRRKLFKHFSISSGQDIGHQDNNGINYMEAHKRYSGNIYGQISSKSWDKLKRTENLDLVIISALYGLLRYDEPIQDYNITMNHKIEHHTLKWWWKNNELNTILKQYININNISEIHCVLSKDYQEALSSCIVNMRDGYTYHDFSKYKSGSNNHRGKWVENFIQNY